MTLLVDRVTDFVDPVTDFSSMVRSVRACNDGVQNLALTTFPSNTHFATHLYDSLSYNKADQHVINYMFQNLQSDKSMAQLLLSDQLE